MSPASADHLMVVLSMVTPTLWRFTIHIASPAVSISGLMELKLSRK